MPLFRARFGLGDLCAHSQRRVEALNICAPAYRVRAALGAAHAIRDVHALQLSAHLLRRMSVGRIASGKRVRCTRKREDADAFVLERYRELMGQGS